MLSQMVAVVALVTLQPLSALPPWHPVMRWGRSCRRTGRAMVKTKAVIFVRQRCVFVLMVYIPKVQIVLNMVHGRV